MLQMKRIRCSTSWRLLSPTYGNGFRVSMSPIMVRLLATKKGSAVASGDDKPKTKPKATKIKIADLNETTARVELLQLNDDINRHDLLYYENSTPEISDATYDKLVRRASDIVGRFQELRPLVSKLDKVGAPVNGNSKFAPFNHTRPMQSLDNAFADNDVESFVNKIQKSLNNQHSCEFVLEPKIDGLSLSLHYVHGELVRAGTRGDGAVGEDVTVNVLQHIPHIPRRVETPQPFLEVRGEVYISRSDFLQLNEERKAANQTVFSTARNAASGSLRRLDNNTSHGVDNRRLRFFAYSLLQGASAGEVSEDNSLVSQFAVLKRLQTLGFTVAQPNEVVSVDFNGTSFGRLYERCKQLESLSSKWEFDADGVVLKVNLISNQRQLGEGTRAPKWAVAFKFSGDVATTTLEDILLQVGRTGVVTPVAQLTPSVIGGVKVERATLHNFNEVRRLGLHKGARVLLKRSGDVIPKVLGLAPQEGHSSESGSGELDDSYCKEVELPTTCPCCGSALVSDTNGTVKCSGGSSVCSAQAIEQISHFCSRDAADIQGLGSAKLEYLYKNGHIKTILDLYRLRDADITGDKITSLRAQKGWGDRSVSNLLSSIDKSRKNLTMARLLYGLGINQLGLQMAKDISEQFNHDFRSFWSYLTSSSSASLERLSSIHGFGPVLESSLIDFASDGESAALVEGLMAVLELKDPQVNHSDKKVVAASPLTGRKVVFTGAFECGLTRGQAQQMCVELGGSFHNSVVKSVDLLVDCSSPEEPKSDKRIKAEKLGIEVWNEQQWKEAVQSKFPL